MKWSVLGLFVLGVLASVAAVVVMMTMQGQALAKPRLLPDAEPAPVEPVSVQVLVAARDLAPREVVAADDVRLTTVDEREAPADRRGDPVQVVGKVLVQPMKQGQAFNGDCFASDGSGLLLASAIAAGGRAVSLTLSDDMGMESLLFPGCMVDVIATIELDSPVFGKAPVSFTLLQEVMVLGVGTSTVVAADGDEHERIAGHERPPVTLLLDADQAELLKLAMERGSVSLSMRNPMDETRASGQEKSLAGLSPALAEVEARAREALRRKEAEETEKRVYEMERERLKIEQARNDAELARLKFEEEKRAIEERAVEQEEAWEVTVLRGSKAETKSFVPPQSKDQR